jgi:hypothetical protein
MKQNVLLHCLQPDHFLTPSSLNCKICSLSWYLFYSFKTTEAFSFEPFERKRYNALSPSSTFLCVFYKDILIYSHNITIKIRKLTSMQSLLQTSLKFPHLVLIVSVLAKSSFAELCITFIYNLLLISLIRVTPQFFLGLTI